MVIELQILPKLQHSSRRLWKSEDMVIQFEKLFWTNWNFIIYEKVIIF